MRSSGALARAASGSSAVARTDGRLLASTRSAAASPSLADQLCQHGARMRQLLRSLVGVEARLLHLERDQLLLVRQRPPGIQQQPGLAVEPFGVADPLLVAFAEGFEAHDVEILVDPAALIPSRCWASATAAASASSSLRPVAPLLQVEEHLVDVEAEPRLRRAQGGERVALEVALPVDRIDRVVLPVRPPALLLTAACGQ